jgi:uncharacterized membrane-anchored protein
MPTLPPDHPERLALADEVHARPPEPLQTPSRATYVAVLVDADARDLERAHLARLCARHDVAPPAAGLTQFSAQLGAVRLKWERHGEFSGYTVFVPGRGERPFTEPASSLLPEGWLAAVPGRTVVAAHGRLIPAGDGPPDAALLAEHFGGNVVVGSRIGEGAGYAFTDFRIHADGFARFLMVDDGFTTRQAGRMLQRLFEIEAYRMLALLALPIARRQSPRIVAIERALAELTDGIARGDGQDEALLHELTRLAAEVESGLSASQFRFGACRAYSELVVTRIAELRELRIPGTQTIEEFMDRRFTPAVATCNTVSQRCSISPSASRRPAACWPRAWASRARNRTRRCWLRWTAAPNCSCGCSRRWRACRWPPSSTTWPGSWATWPRALKSAGAPIDAELLVGLSIPLLVLLVMLALRRARRRIAAAEH